MGPVPKMRTGGFIETPTTPELPGPASEEGDDSIAERIEAQEVEDVAIDPSAEPWRKAVIELLDRGLKPPRIESRFRAWLAENSTASMLLQEVAPTLARELGVEVELNETLFRLESTNPTPSPGLGRQLLDLNLPIETLTKLLPTRADVITKSIDLWQAEQVERMRVRVDELKLSAAAGRERTQASIAAAGHPLPLAQQQLRQAKEKALIRKARASGAL